MSVYPQKGPWAFLYDGDSICFPISHRVTLRWNIILSKGKEAVLLIALC